MILLAALVFALLFFLVTQQMPADPTGITNSTIVTLFEQYTPYGGLAFGLLTLLLIAILAGFFRLVGLSKTRFSRPVLVVLGFAPWAAFGYQLVYREPRYAIIAKAIIEFLGEPLLYAGSALVGVGVLWLIVSFFKPSSSSYEKS
jgi:hypothetical protein